MIRQSQRQQGQSPEPTAPVLARMLAVVFEESQLLLSLHTADPGDDGDNEIAGGQYERQAVDFAVAQGVSPEARSERLVQFSNMPSATITHLGLWDDSDDFLWAGEIVDAENRPVAQRVFAGDRVEFSVGDLIAMFEP